MVAFFERFRAVPSDRATAVGATWIGRANQPPARVSGAKPPPSGAGPADGSTAPVIRKRASDSSTSIVPAPRCAAIGWGSSATCTGVNLIGASASAMARMDPSFARNYREARCRLQRRHRQAPLRLAATVRTKAKE